GRLRPEGSIKGSIPVARSTICKLIKNKKPYLRRFCRAPVDPSPRSPEGSPLASLGNAARTNPPPTGRASDRRGVDAVSLKLGFRLAEEQIACGLLKSCGELSVGQAGLAVFAEGFVAG